MKNDVVIITGGNKGLGLECAKEIVRSKGGTEVLIACRDLQKGLESKTNLLNINELQKVAVRQLDLAEYSSISEFIDWFEQTYSSYRLSGVICNAGVQYLDKTVTTNDSYEKTFAVNHLGHFQLVTNLLDRIVSDRSRIIIVSSGTHDPKRVEGRSNPAKYFMDGGLARVSTSKSLNGMQRYTSSKLCNLLFTYQLDRVINTHGKTTATVNAYDPGGVPQTGLLKTEGSFTAKLVKAFFSTSFTRYVMNYFGIMISTPEKSGKAMARLFLDEELIGVSGGYFQLDKMVNSSEDSYNMAYANELWESSLKIIDKRRQSIS